MVLPNLADYFFYPLPHLEEEGLPENYFYFATGEPGQQKIMILILSLKSFCGNLNRSTQGVKNGDYCMYQAGTGDHRGED